jgi:hypothetical protein
MVMPWRGKRRWHTVVTLSDIVESKTRANIYSGMNRLLFPDLRVLESAVV